MIQDIVITLGYYIHILFDWKVFLGVALLILLFLILKKEYIQTYIYTTGLVTTIILTFVAKHLFQIERPVNAFITLSDYAFPSGHAAISFFFLFFALNYIPQTSYSPTAKKISTSVIVLCAIIISASRVWIGVHTVEQVFFGALLGAIVATKTITTISPKRNFLVE